MKEDREGLEKRGGRLAGKKSGRGEDEEETTEHSRGGKLRRRKEDGREGRKREAAGIQSRSLESFYSHRGGRRE